MWIYLVVFFSALTFDLIPVIAPPAWTVSVFLLVKFHLNPWIVLLLCVSGSTLGRYLMSLYIPKFSDRLLKRRKKEELEFVGKKLSGKLWQSWLFVFLYTVTPLSSTALFTAAGVAKVKAIRTVPAFFCGKFLSDALMLFTGLYAAANFKDLAHGILSPKGILTAVFGLVVIGGFLFLDWRALLQKKKLRFNFGIWK